jgi:tRNA(Ile)-lysidine synthase
LPSDQRHADPEGACRAFLAARLDIGGDLLLGLSGGLDSSVLLHVLAGLRAELGFGLRAVHVHHGLSPNADAWSAHCQRLCAAHGVPLAVERVSVMASGEGLEAAARHARYAAFARHPGVALVLAHHLDDQVETFFLRLLRGSGPGGLAGMAEASHYLGMRVWRPLLDVTRADIEAYARRAGIAGVDDESNRDTRLTRNFLRQTWLAGLAERFPAYRRQVARAMAHARELDDMARAVAEADAACLDDPGHPQVADLRALGAARAMNLLRHWLARHAGATPDSRQLAELWRQADAARPDAEMLWRLGDHEVRRYRGRLYCRARRATVEAAPLAWRGETRLDWAGLGYLEFQAGQTGGLAASRVAGHACDIVGRAGGEHFRPRANRPGKTLKKWFQELDVPPWRRAETPMLRVDGRLAWVAGLGVDVAFQAAPGEAGWLISWRPRP